MQIKYANKRNMTFYAFMWLYTFIIQYCLCQNPVKIKTTETHGCHLI